MKEKTFISPNHRNDDLIYLYQWERQEIIRAITAGLSVLVIGKEGAGKTTLATTIIQEVRGFHNIAIANYRGALKTTLTKLAKELNIHTSMTTPKGRQKRLTVEELKKEIYLNSDRNTLIVIDDAERWPASLRYWLEELQEKGVVLLVLTIRDSKKDLFIRLFKIKLPKPSPEEIRELIEKEAYRSNVRLNSKDMPLLEQRANFNPMLAINAVHQFKCGQLEDLGKEPKYVDISPFVNGILTVLVVIRLSASGLSADSICTIGAMVVVLTIALRYFVLH